MYLGLHIVITIIALMYRMCALAYIQYYDSNVEDVTMVRH